MSRPNLQIKVGVYTGDSSSSRNISGIGFRPDLVIIKNGLNNSVFRTKEMRGDSTGFLTSNNANLSDRIQELLNDGFQVGSAAQVNSTGLVYYYIAIKGISAQEYFRTGNYVGDGNDDRNFNVGGLNFTPDLVLTQAISGSVPAVWKSSAMVGDTASEFNGAIGAANYIQSLIANGFQLGTATRSNASGVEYFFAAMKALAGAIQVGTYTGSGVARSITGLGFKPDVVIIKNYNTTDQARILTTDMVTDVLDSLYMGNTANGANGITSLDTDGFTVGTSVSVNGSTNTMYWIAFKEGDFNAPLTRTAV